MPSVDYGMASRSRCIDLVMEAWSCTRYDYLVEMHRRDKEYHDGCHKRSQVYFAHWFPQWCIRQEKQWYSGGDYEVVCLGKVFEINRCVLEEVSKLNLQGALSEKAAKEFAHVNKILEWNPEDFSWTSYANSLSKLRKKSR